MLIIYIKKKQQQILNYLIYQSVLIKINIKVYLA